MGAVVINNNNNSNSNSNSNNNNMMGMLAAAAGWGRGGYPWRGGYWGFPYGGYPWGGWSPPPPAPTGATEATGAALPLRADWQPDSLKAITDPDVQSFSVLDYTFYYYEDADLNPVYITVTDPDGNVLTKEEWPVVFSALGVGENASQTDG